MNKSEYQVGSHVWHRISRTRNAWRVGEVIEINEKQYSWVKVRQPGTKTTRMVYGYYVDYEITPRMAIPDTPPGTIYIVDTQIGSMLSKRLGNNVRFDVFECGTRAMTDGNLLGYVVVPGNIYNLKDYHTVPGYKTWQIGPNVYELLSFLGNKLPEVIALNAQLSETVHGKKGSDLYSVEAN